MGLLDRFRSPSASHLRVSIEPSLLRPGEELVARIEVTNRDAVQGELAVGLRCRRNQRRRGLSPSGATIADPLVETFDRREVHAEWRELPGSGPWEVRFQVPHDGPRSGDKRRGRHSWRVEVRERRQGASDARAHSSFIVR